MYRHTYKVGLAENKRNECSALIESNTKHIQSKLDHLSCGHRRITQVSVHIATVLVKVN